MRKEPFVTGNFYHVYNRGVDKRTIFQNDRDYRRFLVGLYLFDDAALHDYDLTRMDLRSLASYQSRKLLVDVIHWCLMPNHFHFLVRQRRDNGTSFFMHRLGTSYTKYFNQKYERSGRLLEGPFKAKPVKTDEYFSHLAAYIPLNALDLYQPGWKDDGIRHSRIAGAKTFLRRYPWTSFGSYFGQEIVTGLVARDIFLETFGGSLREYEKIIDSFIIGGIPPKYEAKLRSYEA